MKSTKSRKSTKKIRYAVVGAGHIAQVAFLPGVHHTGNSEITAAVTADPKKAAYLTKKYGVKNIFKYGHARAVRTAFYHARHYDDLSVCAAHSLRIFELPVAAAARRARYGFPAPKCFFLLGFHLRGHFSLR